MTQEKLNELVKNVEANFKSRVTVWGNDTETFIECKGYRGPSKKVEKVIHDTGLVITEQHWSDGSSYTGYYYWVEQK